MGSIAIAFQISAVPGMPLAKDVVLCFVVRGAFGEVVCGVAFAFPMGEVGIGKHEVLTRPEWSVGAILLERAILSANDRPVSAQPVLHGHHSQVDTGANSRAVSCCEIVGPQEESAGLVRARPAAQTCRRWRIMLASLYLA
jgi:hypothetical protein